MSSRVHKINVPIKVLYQAVDCRTGVLIVMLVYDIFNNYIGGNPIALTEIGTTGRYYGYFIPNQIGDWTVMVEQSNGDGKKSESFSVGKYDLQEIGKMTEAQTG